MIRLLSPLTDDLCLDGVGLVAFVLEEFARGGAKRLLIGILGRVAMAADHFLAALNSNLPTLLRSVPGNFDTIGTHGHPPSKLTAL
jgi:hypothetical protein